MQKIGTRSSSRQQSCWIRPSTSPPRLPQVAYGLRRPSPPPSSLSEDLPPTPPLSPACSAPEPRPRPYYRQQITQTQLLEMDDDDLLMEQEKVETSSWCSLNLCLSDPISVPSESEPIIDCPGQISETILSRSTLIREPNRTGGVLSPRKILSDTAAVAAAAAAASAGAVPLTAQNPASTTIDPRPDLSSCSRPPPTPVVVTPPGSQQADGLSLSRIPSLVLAAENQPPLAPLPTEYFVTVVKNRSKPNKRLSSNGSTSKKRLSEIGSSSVRKRPKPNIGSGLLFESITFLLTGFSGSALSEKRAELTKTIESLGGHISRSDSVLECVNLQDEHDALRRIVISNDVSKHSWTVKIFYTLLRGVPAVEVGWIEECRRQNRIVPLRPFAGVFGDILQRCDSHYPRDRRRRPLSGQRIAYFGEKKDEFISIIHAAGAVALRQQNKADLIIWGSAQSSTLRNRVMLAKQASIPVVNLDWLKEAATTQTLPNVRQSPHRLDINI